MVLVTGATGLVGSQLLFDLAHRGEKLMTVKREKSDMKSVSRAFQPHPDLLENIQWTYADILDTPSLERVFEKGIEKVYHCAGIVSFNPEDWESMMKANVQGTANIIRCCLKYKVKKLCHVSSVAAINRINENEIITERTQWRDSKENSNYAISKYLAEKEVWKAGDGGLQFVIVNPTIIIGPGNWISGSSAMFQQVWAGMKFYSCGTAGFVDVRDVTKAMIRLMDSEVHSERFIINTANLPFKDIFCWIAGDLGKAKPRIRANSTLLGFAWRMAAAKQFFLHTKPFITRETVISGKKKVLFSNEKIRNATGIDFIPVRESVKRTCEIFLRERN